jgi:hypothetical protein
MTIQFPRKGVAAGRLLKSGSSLVRRVVQAQDVRPSSAYARGSERSIMSSYRALASRPRTLPSCAARKH